MFKIGKFSVVIKPFLRSNTILDDNLNWRFFTWSRLSIGCERQFRFVFIQEDDISYRWLMIGESADTTKRALITLH